MATGTPFFPRTSELNRSLNWREWSGYFAAGHYHDFHQPEYAAIRNGAALIDVSPLYKYTVEGPDARVLVDRIVTRSARKQKVHQVIYTPWCDEEGKLLQEGTVMRLAPDRFQINAAEPAIRWLRLNAVGLAVKVRDDSAEMAALAVQGPRSRDLLNEVSDGGVEKLAFFHSTSCRIAGADVAISRTGYTGDLGYEVWIPAADTLEVWGRLDRRRSAPRRHALRAHGARRRAYRGRLHPDRRRLRLSRARAHPVAEVVALRARSGLGGQAREKDTLHRAVTRWRVRSVRAVPGDWSASRFLGNRSKRSSRRSV